MKKLLQRVKAKKTFTYLNVLGILSILFYTFFLNTSHPSHTSANSIGTDHTVWAMGSNAWGQLGNGTTTSSSTPTQVSLNGGATKVLAGAYFSVALKSDGTVWTWGYNGYGTLGTGTNDNNTHPYPTQVTALSNIIDIAVPPTYSRYTSSWYAMALRADGTVWTWGRNYFGEIGNGTRTMQTSPVEVIAPVGQSGYLSNIIGISAGSATAFALRDDGTVWAWGDGTFGQFGNGTDGPNAYINHDYVSTAPVQANISNVRSIHGASDAAFAIKSDGTAWTWGQNMNNQLGTTAENDYIKYNSYTDHIPAINQPTQLSNLSNILTATSGTDGNLNNIELFTQSGGAIWKADSNDLPPAVFTDNNNLHNIVMVAQSQENGSLGLRNDGTIWGFGSNYNGELGNGTTNYAWPPTQTLNITRGSSVSLGLNHAEILGD